MDFNKLTQINQENQDKASTKVRDTERELANLRSQETMVKSIQSLAKFMEGHTNKTVVMNQLRDYATDKDVESLVKAIESLHETTKKHENVDLKPLTKVMEGVLKEAKAIPKDHKDITIPENYDYTEQLKTLTEVMKAVDESVKAQETVVEAPVVNVESPEVIVDAPDLKPLEKHYKALEKAVKAIVIPKPVKTDMSKVEKELKGHTKLLKDIRDEAGKGGGSTGGGIGPFMQDGALPVTGTINATPSTLADFAANDLDATNGYYGLTKPDGTWLVLYKTDTSVSYATVTNNVSVTSYTDAWTNNTTLTYGRFDEAF